MKMEENCVTRGSHKDDKGDQDDSPFKNSTFNIFDATFQLISMGLLITDLTTDGIVTGKYFASGDVTWAALTLSFILVPSVILQVFSIRWYLVDDDMSTLKWVTHICQIGPLYRYVNVFRTGMDARRSQDPLDFERLFYQQSDVCMLRLFESFLESAPQVVLQLYIMVATNDENFWTGASALVSLFSLCWALGAYSRAHRKVRRDKKIVSWPGLVLQTIWRIGMISSRVVALVLFASVFKAYIFLVVGIHWFAMMMWVCLQKTDFCSNPLEERLFNSVVAVIYIFCFFNLKEGKSRKRVLVFYSIMLAENTALLLVWYHHRTIGEWYNVVGFTVVFGGFAIGVVSMICYYRYLHPRNDFSLCGSSVEKHAPSSLESTPYTTPSSSPANIFSPELFRHGHSPSPKHPRHPDVNHNEENDGSPLARPLSQTSISWENENVTCGREDPKMVSGEGQMVPTDREDNKMYAVSSQNTADSTVHLERATLHVMSVVSANASGMGSFGHNISGFGSDLVQRFNNKKDRFLAGNDSFISAGMGDGVPGIGGGFHNDSRILTDINPTHEGDGNMPVKGMHNKQATSEKGNPPAMSDGRNPLAVLSPDLQEMPDIRDSPNKVMTAYEAQQIYDSMLGIQRPQRNSKRKLKFEGKPHSNVGLRVSVFGRRKSEDPVPLQDRSEEILQDKVTGHCQSRITEQGKSNGNGNGNIPSTNSKDRDDLAIKNKNYAAAEGMADRPGKSTDKQELGKDGHVTNHMMTSLMKEQYGSSCTVDSNTESGNPSTICKQTQPLQIEGCHAEFSQETFMTQRGKNSDSLRNQNHQQYLSTQKAQEGPKSPVSRVALARHLLKAKERVLRADGNIKQRFLNKVEIPSLKFDHHTACTKSHNHDENERASSDPQKHNPLFSENNGHGEILFTTHTPELEHCNQLVRNEGGCGNSSGVGDEGDVCLNLDSVGMKRANGGEYDLGREGGEGVAFQEAAPHCITDSGAQSGEIKLEETLSDPGAKSPNAHTAHDKPEDSHSGATHLSGNLIETVSTPRQGGSKHNNIKRVRSLKGSVPSPNPSILHMQVIASCEKNREGPLALNTPTHASASRKEDQVGHPFGSVGKIQGECSKRKNAGENLRGRIKRVLSLKGSASSENVASSPTSVARFSSQETLLSDTKVQNQCKKSSQEQSQNVGNSSGPADTDTTLPMTAQASTDQKTIVLSENNQNWPQFQVKTTLYIKNDSPKPYSTAQKKTGDKHIFSQGDNVPHTGGKENTGSAPHKGAVTSTTPVLKKTGNNHVFSHGDNRPHALGKENVGISPSKSTVVGARKGAGIDGLTELKSRENSPAGKSAKKPPRRSLNRIPTNLVAENVALFNSPNK